MPGTRKGVCSHNLHEKRAGSRQASQNKMKILFMRRAEARARLLARCKANLRQSFKKHIAYQPHLFLASARKLTKTVCIMMKTSGEVGGLKKARAHAGRHSAANRNSSSTCTFVRDASSIFSNSRCVLFRELKQAFVHFVPMRGPGLPATSRISSFSREN